MLVYNAFKETDVAETIRDRRRLIKYAHQGRALPDNLQKRVLMRPGRSIDMKKSHTILFLLAVMLLLCSCTNIPVAPTATPTLTDEELIQKVRDDQAATEDVIHQAETQYALDHPTEVPTDTPTPAPSNTPLPVMTATDKPLSYYNIDNKSSLVYKKGDGYTGATSFVPMDELYLEVCYQNNGSGVWTENFYAEVTGQGGGGVTPNRVMLGKTVSNEEWACFSFTNYNPEQSLSTHCPTFQLYNENGNALRNGNNSVCWTIH